MPSDCQHHIHRHPAAPWTELRISVNTHDCYRAHSHEQYSIGIVDAGYAIFHHPDGPHRVQAGSVVLIEPNVIHSCNPTTKQHWSYRMLFVDASWLHQAVAKVWGRPAQLRGSFEFVSRCIDDPSLGKIVNQFCQPMTSEVDAGILTRALPHWIASRVSPAMTARHADTPPELAPALQTMQTDFEKRVQTMALADACGMSTTRFIRFFRAAFGLTPGAYMLNMRVNGARRLLAQGAPLADVAHTMGFADQAHMQRAFKAHHAMTPGNYQLKTAGVFSQRP